MDNFKVYQDGGMFYVDTLEHPDYDGIQPVADFSDMVKHDYDMAGAAKARVQFLISYGFMFHF